MRSAFLLLLASAACVAAFHAPSARRSTVRISARRSTVRMGLFNDPVGWVKRGLEVIQDSREVTASHILIPGRKDKLDEIKPQCTSLEAFSDLAREYSTCPSGKTGGFLGTFGRGKMVPPFDDACFDEANEIGAVVGPVQTAFGWHLIYIQERTAA